MANDILMGYSTETGRPIYLAEHEKTFIEFCEYRGIDPAAWRKTEQVGYYRALQEDWEAARDDDMHPMVVDRLEDLPEDLRARLEA